MTMAERQAAAYERRQARVFSDAICEALAQMQTPAPAIPQEVRTLLLEYRELVNSRSKAAQIDAIVGERAP